LVASKTEDGKVKKQTLGNLSHLTDEVIELVGRGLRGECVVPTNERLEIIASKPHGDVDAVVRAMHRLNLATLLSSRPCHEVDRVIGIVAARIVAPDTKLATTRWWQTRTLAEIYLHAAMDWLLERQDAIERKLAARHL
jgi:hypothetical protein